MTRLAWLPVAGRFVTCGVLSIALGLAWKLTLAPAQVGVASALAGLVALLLGFLVGGIAWYAHDLRQSRKDPSLTNRQAMEFSLIVFAVMPLAVLVLISVCWLVIRVLAGS